MLIVADRFDHAIGVDTHRDTHTAVIINTANTAVVAELTVANTREGFDELILWADHHDTECRVWAVEGCGSYGRRLTRFLASLGEVVAEVERPARPKTRSGAKSDSIDAVKAGRELCGTELARVIQPRCGVERDALEIMLVTRRSAVNEAKKCVTQFHAGLVKAPEALAQRFDGLTTREKLAVALRLRPGNWADADTAAYALSLRSLARRHEYSSREAAELHKAMNNIINTWRPDLLEVPGVGVVVAATVLCAWSHPGRFRSDAAFAAFAGTAPVPSSSGPTSGNMKLNRGGDRHLNSAIYTIVLCRLRNDPDTLAYQAKRTAMGKSTRHTRRCLKRAVTRQLFKQLENHPGQT